MIAQITRDDLERHPTLDISDVGKWALWRHGAIIITADNKDDLQRIGLEEFAPDPWAE